MLILNRGLEEEIVIDNHIVIKVTCIKGKRVWIGIEAPADVPIDREEIALLKGFWKQENESRDG